MAHAFIFIELTEKGSFTSYEKPVLSWVKTNYPELTMLDIDSDSDSVLLQYAGKLLTESERSVVYFKSTAAAPLNQATSLVEQLVKHPKNIMVLLEGQQVFLQNLFTARTEIDFLQADSAEKLLPEITRFLKVDKT